MEPDPSSLFIFSNMLAIQPSLSDYFLFALLILLIFVNAIISGSEAAFLSLRKDKNKDLTCIPHPNDIRIDSLLSRPEELTISLYIAYNLLNVAILILTLYLLNRLPYFSHPTLWNYIGEIAIAASMILIFVEIMPKLYASSDQEIFKTLCTFCSGCKQYTAACSHFIN